MYNAPAVTCNCAEKCASGMANSDTFWFIDHLLKLFQLIIVHCENDLNGLRDGEIYPNRLTSAAGSIKFRHVYILCCRGFLFPSNSFTFGLQMTSFTS